MKVRDLYAARPLESQQHPLPDYRSLYRQAAEAMEADCWTLPPHWLLDHPEQWEQIKTLDGQLTTMERLGATEAEYRATLARLVKCVCDARASCARHDERQAS